LSNKNEFNSRLLTYLIELQIKIEGKDGRNTKKSQ
jgi:hypothetical protein